MRLSRIEVEGFRGFKDREYLDVPPGFLIIQGANGAGKSSICDAIDFGISGRISKFPVEKAGNETASDYYWWRGTGKSSGHFVRLTFVDDLGNEFVVTRSRDGCDRSEDEIRTALCFDSHPDAPLAVLADTGIIRDDSIASLSLDITDTERYQRVQKALGAVLRRDFSGRSKAVASQVDTFVRAIENQEARTRTQLTQALAEQSQAQSDAAPTADVDNATRRLSELFPDLQDDVPAMIAAGRKEAANAQRLYRERMFARDRLRIISSELAVLRSETFSTELLQTRESLGRLDEAVAVASNDHEAAEADLKTAREADEWIASFSVLLHHGEEIGLQLGHCPLCDQAQGDAEFQNAIADARAKLAARGADTERAQSNSRLKRDRYYQAREALEAEKAKLASLEARHARSEVLHQEAQELLRHAGIVAFGSITISEDTLERAIENARERAILIDSILRTIASSRALTNVAETTAKIESLRTEADRLSSELGSFRRSAASAKAIEQAVTRTSGDLLDERLAMITPLMSELFQRLRPHGDWRKIDYKIRGDVRRFLSLSVGDDLNPQFVFSSGQKRATGIAFLISMYLTRYWAKWNTLVLDDPVQHVDDFRALHLVEVLSSLRRDGRQVICAIEDEALANLLCRRLRSSEAQPGGRVTIECGTGGRSHIGKREFIASSSKRLLDDLRQQRASA